MRVKIRLPRRSLGLLLLLGISLVPLESFAFFFALNRLPASSASVLVNLYPLHMAWMGWVFLGEHSTLFEVLMLVVLILGGFLVSLQTLALGQGIGLLAVGLSTVFYSAYIISMREMLVQVRPHEALAVILPSATAVFVLAALFGGQLRLVMPLEAACAIAGSALIATLLAPLLRFLGLRAVTIVRAALLSSFEPVVTIVASVVLLGDRLTPLRLVGFLVIIVAIVVLRLQRSGLPPSS
jgi:drug/metabolite transporter (DMT)-like permease